ncbi:type IV pilin protein [Candidatus Avelusimicrobium facis]|uniref:type IV pilin protein n=1 Tax=Candidatus Avelusimicrobium facis TaxID=3416203 RepID=UPI003D133146
MKNRSTGHLSGFTLIELLVVVLIIGILSAIALPQYTTAVEKARAAEAVQNIAMMEKQIDLYIMENGIPSSGQVCYGEFASATLPSDNPCLYETKNFDYSSSVHRFGGEIEVVRRYPNGNEMYTFYSSTEPNGYNDDSPTGGWYRACITQMDDIGRKVCRQFEGAGWKYADGEL